MVGEMWFYPDGRRLLELSTKCAPGETMQVATETRLFLADHDIDVTGVQETKTKNALQYFAKEVKAVASGAASEAAAASAAAAAAADGDGSSPEVTAGTGGTEAPVEEAPVSADADPD
jgi:hypothetical protein